MDMLRKNELSFLKKVSPIYSVCWLIDIEICGYSLERSGNEHPVGKVGRMSMETVNDSAGR